MVEAEEPAAAVESDTPFYAGKPTDPGSDPASRGPGSRPPAQGVQEGGGSQGGDGVGSPGFG